MEESQVAIAAKRRVNKIAGHFAALTNDDIISSTTHLLPRNCSGGLNSVIRRCDNRMYYARQSSDSQAYYMRPNISKKQNLSNTAKQPLYARPGKGKCNGFTDSASEAPSFSKPSSTEPLKPKFLLPPRPLLPRDETLTPEAPVFAKPGNISNCLSANHYKESPTMVVSEFGHKYLMTVEIPGVSINDIKVEVHDQSLSVTAKRCSKGSMCTYRRREEPYRVFWPLSADVNKDGISAEFLDGLLQIIIPKI